MSNADGAATGPEAEIGSELIDLVPHWYQADYGPERYSIDIGDYRATFCNHCRLTPTLAAFHARVCARTRELALKYFLELPSLIDVLLESMAMEWLRIHSSGTNWTKLIRYLESLARRTYENQPVVLNLVIRAGTGSGDITDPRLQKFLDRLASSPYSMLAVDRELRLMEYGEVAWAQVKDADSLRFYPEFLHPIHSILENGDFSAHLTSQGDLIIMNKSGLLAARRQRKWKLYDVRTFKNSLSYCLGNYSVGVNLFEIVFDLSFRREGALLIYDPDHRLGERILNSESILFPGWRGAAGSPPDTFTGQSLIGRSLENIAIGKGVGSLKRKKLLIEMACVDGAVVFDDERLLAVGALIRSHPGVGSHLGARTTAARSAYLWGAHPIMVSSDGDVTIYFKSTKDDKHCDAEMHFL
jgi:hypothetical protein